MNAVPQSNQQSQDSLPPWESADLEQTDNVLASTPAATVKHLNADQEDAISRLLNFIQNEDIGGNWFYILSGGAGTGKTFCMEHVTRIAASSRINIVYTAPTNKAAKVLKQRTGNASTIYSLLGLRVDKTGEIKTVVEGKKADLSNVDIIVVDEASMVNGNLFRILEDQARRFSVKVVFMGDPAQLPPVGEAHSPIWQNQADSCLTRVMRHDNQILTLVTDIRNQMDSIAPSINLRSDNDKLQGVFKLDKQSFKRQLFEAAARGEFADGSSAKAIAWRNVRVNEYNALIRSAIFGAAAKPGFYLPGDRIVAAGPCERGDEFLMATDDEAIVESVLECKHPLEPKYAAIELMVRREDNRKVRLLCLHPASAMAFDNDSQAIAHDARANGKLWKKFWQHKELFHDVRYGYALTAHRAQGSTYTDAYVDFQDILYNRNRKEAFQCLYVACSRPTTRLFLA